MKSAIRINRTPKLHYQAERNFSCSTSALKPHSFGVDLKPTLSPKINLSPFLFQTRTSYIRHSIQPHIPRSTFCTEKQSTIQLDEEDLLVHNFMSTLGPVVEEKSISPKEFVSALDKFIIGQTDAKKAVALAVRNRWRRLKLAPKFRDEIAPKNILMIGPTGVGKTEIARRMAKMLDAPFVKVEATKYTEVGFYGADVDDMIDDLARESLQLVTNKLKSKFKEKLSDRVDEAILTKLLGKQGDSKQSFKRHLASGELDFCTIAVEIPESKPQPKTTRTGRTGNIIFNTTENSKFIIREMSIKEARPIIENQEFEKLFPSDLVKSKAKEAMEQGGVVFIDEIDKIVGDDFGNADASDIGVQRDLLPLIEGTVVKTGLGHVDTSKILFIASGAFHMVKPSDLLPELQGRLPIRVQLKPLSRDDLKRILVEPENNLLNQQVERFINSLT